MIQQIVARRDVGKHRPDIGAFVATALRCLACATFLCVLQVCRGHAGTSWRAEEAASIFHSA